MKTTIYELLGMIKDGKAPKKIIYNNEILYFDDETKNYYNDEDMHPLFSCIGCVLNDEVEILEEEKKIPEKLDISGGISVVNCAYKINEIIDYLKSKGE